MRATSRLALAAVAALLALHGCARDSGGPAVTGPVRCTTPVAFPNSVPFPEQLRAAVGAVNVPPGSPRTTCNRLALEPGAFARKHATDRIDWRTWSEATLAEAKSLDRPVLAVSGSSACADCDRLARGAFARRRLVRDINRYFVPVLVDREQRPDVDAYLMLATQVLTGGAGWPAAVFLLADGRPFEARSWGAAGTGDRTLARLVEDIRRRIALGGGTIQEKAELTMQKMERRAALDPSGPLPDAAKTSAALAGYVREAFDRGRGSFGEPPLFARPPIVEFLLGRRDDADALAIARTHLEKLATSALADGDGGFFRFAKEAGWKEPAREKMLGENAATASAFLEAAMATGDAAFLDRGRRTADFLLSRLSLSDGSFAASIAEDGSRDERVLADANALAISALARAATAAKEPRYLDAAVAAAKILDVRLRDGSVMNHCLEPGGRRCSDGYLTDQVFAGLAFLDLADANAPNPERWLEAARSIADAMPEKFGHEGTGAFFLTRTVADPLPLRLEPAFDGAVASANSAAAMFYVRLASRTGDASYASRAHRTFEAFSEVLELRPLALPSMVAALQLAAGSPAASAPPQLDPAPAVHP